MIKILRILFSLFFIGQSFSQTPILFKQNSQLFMADEFLIDTNMLYIPQLREQEDPSIAFDGTNYLVVWSDYRSGHQSLYANFPT